MKKMVFIGLFLLVVVGFAFASTADTGMPWEDTVDTIKNSIQNLILPLGIIAVIAGAVMLAKNEGQGATKLIWILIAIGIAGAAGGLITKLSDVSAGCTVNEIHIEEVQTCTSGDILNA